jgi:hypothetical protein
MEEIELRAEGALLELVETVNGVYNPRPIFPQLRYSETALPSAWHNDVMN